ncbi:MAG TPA: SDR family oxidoreductase [Candidatus Deferrimicrobiaceae bacterium]
MSRQRILVLGASGMLGHVLFRKLSERPELEVHATCRNRAALEPHFSAELLARIRHGVIADDFASLRDAIGELRPAVVVNCIGIVKQLAEAEDPLVAIPVNALLPHRLAKACGEAGARLVHVSTDCVFTGRKGHYTEDDPSDADDLYGRSKRLGEVTSPGAVTLRTSIIGHELSARHGLLEWFLAQQGPVRGFARAIFTGFPTVELARIIAERVIPDPGLTGLYHVSSDPISKYDLLGLFAAAYGKTNEIVRDESFACDRSLDSGRFRAATGYRPPPWPDLVRAMHEDAVGSYKKETSA